MADHSYQIDVTDVEKLVALCRKEKIDGIICPYLDIVQMPYQQICERMGYPCFGTKKQHQILTDKIAFKEFCKNHGADVIPSFSEERIRTNEVEYPILIKPADSRGSRGQTVCFSRAETENALFFAKSESRNGQAIIEKYMVGMPDLHLQYLVVNGEPILYKVEDRYLGSKENGFDKLCITEIGPSKYMQQFKAKANPAVVNCIKQMGLKNSPVFIQAFFDGEKAYLYDPGIRMPGDDYDDGQKIYTGIDIPDILIRFALSGEISDDVADMIKKAKMDGYCTCVMPCIKTGVVSEIQGLNEIAAHPNVISYSTAYEVGEQVLEHKNVKQRYGEFVIIADNKEKLRDEILWLYDTLHVYDSNGNEMLIEKFETEQLSDYLF